MKILGKLLIGFIAVAMLCGIVGVVGISQISNLYTSIKSLQDETLPTLRYLNIFLEELTNLKVAIRTLAHPSVVDDEVIYKRELDLIEQSRANYKAALASFEAIPMIPEEEKLYQDIKGHLGTAANYNNNILQLIAKAKAGGQEEKFDYMSEVYDEITGDSRLAYDELLAEVKKLVEFDENYYGVEVPKVTLSSAESGRIILILVTILAFLLAIALGLFLGTSISRPLKKTVEVLDRLAMGDISQNMVTKSKDEFKQVVESLNSVTSNISALIKESEMLTVAAVQGNLSTRGDTSKFKGGYFSIVEGVNKTLDAVIKPLNVAANYVDRISKGDLPPTITDNYNGDFNTLKDNLNTCIVSLNGLKGDLLNMIQGQKTGDIEARCSGKDLQGVYSELAQGVNEALETVIAPVLESVALMGRYAHGDLSTELRVLPGKQIVLTNGMNAIRTNVIALINDTNILVQSALEGLLSTRADASKHQGDYRKIVEGVNQTLDLVVGPINEVIDIMKKLAEGDLTSSMNGNYKGDFDVLKTAINSSLVSIGETLSQINIAVDQVAEGSLQVSQASQSLSQGATEQASSLEEITSSVTQIASQTKQNTESAAQMTGLAKTAKKNAEQGNIQMVDLVSAMSDINKSAEEIKKIVKAIDDISFQINLLALNANVEAARAGKYGKGFAVVAEEVRNLAVRSANSVKETTRMVDEAIANITRGNNLVDGTAKQLNEIVIGAAQVASLSEEVATAGREQSQGLEQISLGLNQIDQVTQANTASAEESASASEELSSQSQEVKNMLSRFKLKNREQKLNNSDLTQLVKAELAKQSVGIRSGTPPRSSAPISRGNHSHVNPSDVISLDDSNFGKF